MNFYKQVLILKERQKGYSVGDKEASGIVRIEYEDNCCTLSLSLINFATLCGGEYYCYIYLDNDFSSIFSLGKKPTGHIKTFNVEKPFKGVSVGIFVLEEDMITPLPVAFSTAEGGVSEEFLTKTFSLGVNSEKNYYNDEAVATENYYTLDESIEKKVQLINGWENEGIRDETTKEYYRIQEEIKKGEFGNDGVQDEKSAEKGVVYTRDNPYYLSAREELEDLFSKFPKDESLSSTLPTGRFCKIHYAKDKHYTVGTVEEGGEVKYVCYGVPGSYAPTPPNELKDYCTFIPLSIFDLQGEGFWMMFQDAITGECVKKKN